MKTILITFTLALSTFYILAQSENEFIEEGTTITITVPVKSDLGKVVFGLYTESTFLKNPIMGWESAIQAGKAVATFEKVQPGTYAVVLFHDKNGNNRMDFDPSGMPTEMYGVSNNQFNFGPPQWNDAKFEVKNQEVLLEIIM